jgi:hypothetical protein
MSPGSSTKLLGLEVLENLERHPAAGAGRSAADRPAPPALRLQQEHVVAVEMRPDAAFVAGVADHQIVQARIGHEAKLLQQCVHAVMVQIDALHQQGPFGLLQRRQRTARERPVPERPAGLAVADKARFHLLALGQGKERAALDRRHHGGYGLAHEQRFFLPIPPHELRGAQAAEQRQRLCNLHGRILQWKSLNNAWSA